MRSPSAEPTRLFLVDPAGRIRGLPVHVVEQEDGATVLESVSHWQLAPSGELSEQAKGRGWARLRDLYRDDVLGERGFEVFRDYDDARGTGRPGDLPDHWLPAEVRRRRAERTAPEPWKAPTLPKKKGASA